MSTLAPAPAAARQEGQRPWLSFLPVREFFHVDLRSLALFRIGLALLLLYDCGERLPELHALYSDAGIVPRTRVLNPGPIVAESPDQVPAGALFPIVSPVSVHFFDGSVTFQAVLLGVAVLFALALLVGYQTRLVTLVSWFLVLSVQARNPFVLHGGDVVFRMLLFWALFLPLGARYSVDALRAGAAPGDPRHVSAGSFALLAQLVIIYLFAAAWKWDPAWRKEWTGVLYALKVDHFPTLVGRWLVRYPELLKLLTMATMVLETVGPVCLFMPFATGLFRTATAFSFILFHAGLALCMALGYFPYVCIVGWLAVLPTWFWDQIGAWLYTPARTGWTVRFQGATARCRRAVDALRRFLFLPAPAAQEGGKSSTPVTVVDHQGGQHPGFDGALYLVRLSPVYGLLARPLGWGPLRRLGERLWVWCQGGDPRAPFTPPAPARVPALGIVGSVLALFCLGYVLLWNLRTFSAENQNYLPPQQSSLGHTLGLEQGWGLFAPRPTIRTGWLVAPATLADGTAVDLMRGGAPVEWEEPRSISAQHPTARYRKLVGDIHTPSYAFLLPHYTDYRFRQWHLDHPDRPLEKFELYHMGKTNVLERYGEPPDQTLLVSYRGWFVVQGFSPNAETKQVDKIDLLRDGRPVTDDRPPRVTDLYPGPEWRDLYADLSSNSATPTQRAFVRQVARRWRARHPERPLLGVELYFVRDIQIPGYRYASPQPTPLIQLTADELGP